MHAPVPRLVAVAAAAALLVAGCDRDDEEVEPVADDYYQAVEQADEQPDQPDEAEQPDEEAEADPDDPRRETADEADQQLRQRLMGRVMEVAEEDGFDAAVDVCHDEAMPLTEEVADEFDVAIGRVSDRLRNPDNRGEEWVWSMIEEADDEPHYAANEQFRAVKPIEVAEPCVSCHGETDQLAEGVAEQLEEHYPEDEATGYDIGDIRGWVWVEVPGS